MAVKVISKRSFEMDTKKELIPLLRKLRSLARKQSGYISRETLRSLDEPGQYVVISEWKSADHWKQCLRSKEVRKIQGQIDSLIGEKTFYGVFEPEKF